jgi:hypothetical protein
MGRAARLAGFFAEDMMQDASSMPCGIDIVVCWCHDAVLAKTVQFENSAGS